MINSSNEHLEIILREALIYIPEIIPRNRQCTQVTMRHLPHALQFLVISNPILKNFVCLAYIMIPAGRYDQFYFFFRKIFSMVDKESFSTFHCFIEMIF